MTSPECVNCVESLFRTGLCTHYMLMCGNRGQVSVCVSKGQ